MATNVLFQGELRETIGKGSSRELRRTGFIPAILYGGEGEPVKLRIDRRGAERIISHLEAHNIIADLVIKDDKKEETLKTIVKEIQFDPVTSEVLHLDFYRMRLDKPVTLDVAVRIIGDCAGVKAGGILEQELRELSVEALPRDIPERIDVDVTALNIGDSLTVKDIVVAAGVRVLEDADRTVVSIQAPRKVEEEVKPAEEVAAVAAEPEVISEEKAEERRKQKEEADKESKKESKKEA